MSMIYDISIVAAIDFGVKYSTFAYAYKSNPTKLFINKNWPYCIANYKIPTVLKYDESFNLISWGYSALSERPRRNKRNKNSADTILVENFLLYLSKTNYKPYLPEGLDYKKAITDYLSKMGDVIKETFRNCSHIDFFKNVLIMLPISVEYDDKAKEIIRECAYNACLIDEKNSLRLQFITKHDAVSIHCIYYGEFNVSDGSTFMIVDCGCDTVELITQKLLENKKLGEITGRNEGFCGGNFVDDEFIKFLCRKVGPSAIDFVRKNHYGQLQYMIQEFCKRVKFPFTGQHEDFNQFNLDLEDLCPAIKQYVEGSKFDEMEEIEWCIEPDFEDVKAMFDPVIEKILQLIRTQLNAVRSCEAMILVGDFSQSRYLQARIKQEFYQRNINIIVPQNPTITIVEGAVQYGLMFNELDYLDKYRIKTNFPRVFEKTYGIKITRKWNSGDPIECKLPDGMINVFLRIAKQGDEIPTDTGISMIFSSNFISRNSLDLFVTDEYDVKYCDSPGVNLIGTFKINTPSTFKNNAISITLFFDDIKIKVVAQEVDVKTGWKYETVLDIIH
ncbi:hypothetical protein RclHR1_18450001 [Rhizophagus clarus]|uniref:Actin-like ATPase domain-containing protein n=1 Tax=Rhizophagus clarus TaxID=94130 RepID=A0A2Z6R2U1_9GLOM|nr:hypothetical protein RclHR1_18450001 [Rhizophagus clarus]GES78550.1 hypothetical protein GLOIN_2v1732694 [Rhizophagus clarus]